MGSRILAHSFNVEKWDSGEGEDENVAANTSCGREMDIISLQRNKGNKSTPHHDKAEEEDGGGIDDLSNIAMVPIAYMLNVRYGLENVRTMVFLSITLI
jgi:SET domain-containing protein 6